MFKKYLVCIMATLTLAAIPVCIFADNVTVTATFSLAKDSVTISGNAEKNVVITIAHVDVKPQMMSEENLPDVIKAVTAFDGKYSCEIGLPTSVKNGKNMVYVTTEDGEASTSFMYVDKTEADPIVESINSIDTLAARVSKFYENEAALGVNPEEPVYSKSKSKFAETLWKSKYKDCAEFIEAYNKLYPLIALSGASSSEIKVLLESNAELLGIDFDDDILNDTRLTDAAEMKLYELISAEDFAKDYTLAGSGFADRIEQLKALASLQTVHNWMTVKNIITEDFNDTFESLLDNETFELVDDKDSVYGEMMEYSFSSFSAIKEAFENAAETIYDFENPPKKETPGRPSGSGGGVGSVGSEYKTSQEIELYEETESYGDVFSDVPRSHWANKAVNLLNGSNVISGYPDGTFLPSNPITRAEFTKLTVAFANGLEIGELISFSDVSATDWFYPYVSDASAYGVVSGVGNGNFDPYSNIKREDAALIVYRLLDSMGKTPIGSKVFADRSEISDYARLAISALGSSGIVSGEGNGNFKPKDFITRAEAAQLLYNAFVK